MDQKTTSNGNVQVWLVPAIGIADYRSPTAAEINAGLNVTSAIAWDGTTIPAASESDDTDDRSLLDKGNATTRGAAQFEGTLNFFYPDDLNENVTDYGKAFTFLHQPRVAVYAVVRVLQAPEGIATPAAAGEWVSVFRFLTDGWTDDIADDDAYKYAIGLLAQGEVSVYTQVKNATPVTVTNASGTASIAVDDHLVLRATLGGKRATQVVEWTSSNPAVANVSSNGVVTGVGPGTANITASHRAASAPSTAIAVTVTP